MDNMSNAIGQYSYSGSLNASHMLRPNRQSPHQYESETVKPNPILMDLQEACECYKTKDFSKASTIYKAILQSLENMETIDEYYNKDIIHYMLSISLMESNELKDLQDSLEHLLDLEHNRGESIPAVYYALVKLHIKFCRFEPAVKAMHKGFALLNTDAQYHIWCIPGTCFTMPESTKDGLLVRMMYKCLLAYTINPWQMEWFKANRPVEPNHCRDSRLKFLAHISFSEDKALMTLRDTMTEWKPPNAECFLINCQNRTKYYLPSRNIYFSDPSFDGMVTTSCNNQKGPCALKFHWACWMFQKQEILKDDILSDREMIGYPCFNPDCKNERYIISKIEMSKNGEVQIIRAPKSRTVIPQLTPVKGAVKKQYQTAYELKTPQMFEGYKCVSQDSVTEELLHNEKDGQVSNSDIAVCKHSFKTTTQNSGPAEDTSDLSKINFTKDSNSEPFLYEFLYDYIKANGPISTLDICTKWDEINRTVGNICSTSTSRNVMQILLDSGRVVTIGNYVYAPSASKQMDGLSKLETLQEHNKVNRNETETKHGNDDSSIEAKDLISLEDDGNIVKMIDDHIKANDAKLKKELGTETKHDGSFFIEENKGLVGNDIWDNKYYPDRLSAQSFTQKSAFKDSLKESDSINQWIDSDLAPSKKTIVKPSTKASLEKNEHCGGNEDQNATGLEKFSKLMSEFFNTKTSEPLEVCRYTEKDVQRRQFLSENVTTKDDMSQRNVFMLGTGVKPIEQTNDHLQKSIKYLSRENEMSAKYEMKLSLKNKEILNLKEEMFKMKKELLRTILDCQFSANQALMLKSIEKCNISIEVITEINCLFKESFGFAPLSDSEQWSTTFNDLHNALEMHQEDYSRLTELVKSSEDMDEIDHIVFKLKNIPEFPKKSLCETVINAFHHYASTCNEMNKSIQNFTGYHDEVKQRSGFDTKIVDCKNLMKLTTNREAGDILRSIKLDPKYQLSTVESNLKSVGNGISRPGNSKKFEKQNYQLPDRTKYKVTHEKTGSTNRPTLTMQNTKLHGGSSIRRRCNDIDKIMYYLHINNPGIMDLDLLECVMKVRDEFFDNSLSTVPFVFIIEKVQELVLQIQEKYLCLYESTENTIISGDQDQQFISNQRELQNHPQESRRYFPQCQVMQTFDPGMGRGYHSKKNKKSERGRHFYR